MQLDGPPRSGRLGLADGRPPELPDLALAADRGDALGHQGGDPVNEVVSWYRTS